MLDVRKMREADRLVSFFTEDEGKIRGVAASAAKSRRRFGGKLERLSRVRVTYFEKEGRELARIDSCDLLDESFTLHQDLRVATTLAYVAEIVDTFAREREADRRYFRLIKSLIAALKEQGDARLLARYFEVWTLRLHGLLPDLDRCGACGKDLMRPGGGGAEIEAGDMPVALCPACRRAAGAPAGRLVRLSAGSLTALERFRKLAPAALTKEDLSPAVMTEIERFGVALLTAFVGREFRSYRFLGELGFAEGDAT